MKNQLKTMVSKVAVLLVFSLFLVSCQSTDEKASNTNINQEITSEEGELILVGQIDRTAWEKESYRDWFTSEYQAYEVDKTSLAPIKSSTESLEILVFLGTWCSDSQREIPRFHKVLEFLEFYEDQLQLIGLDDHPERNMQSPQHEELGWDIKYVPTFIFLRDGKEIGRIVETPELSLEKDLVKILEKGEVNQ